MRVNYSSPQLLECRLIPTGSPSFSKLIMWSGQLKLVEDLTLSCPGTGRDVVKIGHSNLWPGSKELNRVWNFIHFSPTSTMKVHYWFKKIEKAEVFKCFKSSLHPPDLYWWNNWSCNPWLGSIRPQDASSSQYIPPDGSTSCTAKQSLLHWIFTLHNNSACLRCRDE